MKKNLTDLTERQREVFEYISNKQNWKNASKQDYIKKYKRYWNERIKKILLLKKEKMLEYMLDEKNKKQPSMREVSRMLGKGGKYIGSIEHIYHALVIKGYLDRNYQPL